MNRKSKSQNEILQMGWAENDITPTGLVSIAGQFYERVSSKVRDRLFATALAVENIDGNGVSEQAIIITCDLLNIDKAVVISLRSVLENKLRDFDTTKLIINATHIHTGPYTSKTHISHFAGKAFMFHTDIPDVTDPDEYGKFLISQLADAACKAWEQRKAVKLERALRRAVIGHNRLVLYSDGTGAMYGNTDTEGFEALCGTNDHGVEILICRSEQGELEGIVVNVACPSQVLEDASYISADYWGEVRKKLNDYLGREVYVLPMCAAAGDQSPRDLVRRGRAEADMYNESGAEELAERIVREVIDALESEDKTQMQTNVFKHVTGSLELPMRKVTKKQAEQAKKEYSKLIEENNIDDSLEYYDKSCSIEVKMQLFVLSGIINRFDYQSKHDFYECEVHVMRIGDIALATNPFELYVEYGLRIKARSKAEQTFIAQLSCGGDGGYLPTKAAIEAGGYGAIVASGVVGYEGGKVLVDKTIEMINNLFE